MLPIKNNFLLLRILFALFVIATHAVLLSGSGENDFLFQWSHQQLNLSYLGVRGFFVISGFLIYKSLLRSSSLIDYATKRALRIFPGLLCALLLTAFVIGPCCTQLSWSAYWSNPSTYTYVLSSLKIPGIAPNPNLPGCFTQNPYSAIANGSLWTIWYELLCYAGIASFFILKSDSFIQKLVLSIVFLNLYIGLTFFDARLSSGFLPGAHSSLSLSFDVLIYFIAGALGSFINWKSFTYKKYLAWGATAVLVLSVYLHLSTWTLYICWPLIVLSIGTMHFKAFDKLQSWGDPSYGLYIYAFPMQQVLVQLHPMQGWQLFCASLLVLLPIAYGSWHLLERRCIQLKKRA